MTNAAAYDRNDDCVSRQRAALNWETMNKFRRQNNDFETFLSDVQRNIEAYIGRKLLV